MTTFRSTKTVEAVQYEGGDESIVQMLRAIYANFSYRAQLNPDYNDRLEFGGYRMYVGDWLYTDDGDIPIVVGNDRMHEYFEEVAPDVR